MYALNLTEKLLLLAIIVETGYGSRPTSTGKVYARYAELARLHKVKPITMRRLQDVLKGLAKTGILRVRVQSFGRYGKTSIIVLRQPPHSLCLTLIEDLIIGEAAEEVCKDTSPRPSP
jgi:Cdc6-like AAA superfamily ATPase